MRTLYVEVISRFEAISNFFHTTQHALDSPHAPNINKAAYLSGLGPHLKT